MAASWSFADGNGIDGLNRSTGRAAYTPRLEVFSSKLYVIWDEINGGVYQIRASVYNGNDIAASWSGLDGISGLNFSGPRTALDPQLITFGSHLYATWSEITPTTISQIRVALYNGNDSSPGWSFIDGNGINGINKLSGSPATRPQLAVSNSKLYGTWVEDVSGKKNVRVVVGN